MIATTAVDIGKAVLFFPVLERHGKRTALAYLATMIFEVTLAIWLLVKGFTSAAYDAAGAGGLTGDQVTH